MIDYITWLLKEPQEDIPQEELCVMDDLSNKKRHWFRRKKSAAQLGIEQGKMDATWNPKQHVRGGGSFYKSEKNRTGDVISSSSFLPFVDSDRNPSMVSLKGSTAAVAVPMQETAKLPLVDVRPLSAINQAWSFHETARRTRRIANYWGQEKRETVLSVSDASNSLHTVPDLYTFDRCFQRDARRYDNGFLLQ